MSRTYKATGINLKGIPLGESDRLLTVLTRECGLIRAVAPGARKQNSSLSGRSGLFVVNELLVAKGRSLDKITQAVTVKSYPGLSRSLEKLAAGQYLAELVLCQAMSEQPQEELFSVLCEHLSRLEVWEKPAGGQKPLPVVALLAHGVFHMLALAGIAPQVQSCCLSKRRLNPDFTHPNWRAGFSVSLGGTVSVSEIAPLGTPALPPKEAVKTAFSSHRVSVSPATPVKLDAQLKAVELALLQQLAAPQLSWPDAASAPHPAGTIETAWVSVERILRQYAQYHFDRSIRSAALMDNYFASLADFPASYDATV
jgi:DNA repair protein RecO (recombination protein O)